MPTHGAIRGTLMELLEADMGESFTDLIDGVNLREDVGLDSVDILSIVLRIERRFEIHVSKHDIEVLVSIDDMLNLIEYKLRRRPSSAVA